MDAPAPRQHALFIDKIFSAVLNNVLLKDSFHRESELETVPGPGLNVHINIPTACGKHLACPCSSVEVAKPRVLDGRRAIPVSSLDCAASNDNCMVGLLRRAKRLCTSLIHPKQTQAPQIERYRRQLAAAPDCETCDGISSTPRHFRRE